MLSAFSNGQGRGRTASVEDVFMDLGIDLSLFNESSSSDAVQLQTDDVHLLLTSLESRVNSHLMRPLPLPLEDFSDLDPSNIYELSKNKINNYRYNEVLRQVKVELGLNLNIGFQSRIIKEAPECFLATVAIFLGRHGCITASDVSSLIQALDSACVELRSALVKRNVTLNSKELVLPDGYVFSFREEVTRIQQQRSLCTGNTRAEQRTSILHYVHGECMQGLPFLSDKSWTRIAREKFLLVQLRELVAITKNENLPLIGEQALVYVATRLASAKFEYEKLRGQIAGTTAPAHFRDLDLDTTQAASILQSFSPPSIEDFYSVDDIQMETTNLESQDDNSAILRRVESWNHWLSQTGNITWMNSVQVTQEHCQLCQHLASSVMPEFLLFNDITVESIQILSQRFSSIFTNTVGLAALDVGN